MNDILQRHAYWTNVLDANRLIEEDHIIFFVVGVVVYVDIGLIATGTHHNGLGDFTWRMGYLKDLGVDLGEVVAERPPLPVVPDEEPDGH